jgi:hypothetical protein
LAASSWVYDAARTVRGMSGAFNFSEDAAPGAETRVEKAHFFKLF